MNQLVVMDYKEEILLLEDDELGDDVSDEEADEEETDDEGDEEDEL